jgi:RND family efflux transporter MFP subunit
MAGLVSSRDAPKKLIKREKGALVRVVKVKRADYALLLKGTGTVQPARSVTIVPEVSGRLRYVSDSMVPGGMFTEGKVLMKIEDVDYRLNVERAMAALAMAEYELLKVEGEARVARSVWKSSTNAAEKGAEPNPLVVHIPQLKRARAGLVSAKAALKQERINLERTVLGAPFNSIVRAESAELGQYVRAGVAVATLVGTDSVEVVVPLKVDDIGWIEIPGAGSEKPGARATVSMNTGGRVHKWHGRVVRSLGEVDPDGRMERVVIRVEDPYGLRSGSVAKSGSGVAKPSLTLGSFVNVEIEGGSMRNVIVISRSALRDSNTVWTVLDGNSLKIVNVVPLRVEAKTVVLKSGLTDGAVVVTTELVGAADGMVLRTVENGTKRSSAARNSARSEPEKTPVKKASVKKTSKASSE